jgi:hypothetical protein
MLYSSIFGKQLTMCLSGAWTQWDKLPTARIVAGDGVYFCRWGNSLSSSGIYSGLYAAAGTPPQIAAAINAKSSILQSAGSDMSLLYIGKAQSLRRRIRRSTDPAGSILSRRSWGQGALRDPCRLLRQEAIGAASSRGTFAGQLVQCSMRRA